MREQCGDLKPKGRGGRGKGHARPGEGGRRQCVEKSVTQRSVTGSRAVGAAGGPGKPHFVVRHTRLCRAEDPALRIEAELSARFGRLPRLLIALMVPLGSHMRGSRDQERSTAQSVPSELIDHLGLSEDDLNTLVERGFAQLVTTESYRPSQSADGSTLIERLALTPSGVAMAESILEAFASAIDGRPHPLILHPRWEKVRRELRLGETILKRFRKSAPNQETLLDAFEEQDWQLRVDDPLPPKSELVPAERLRETVKRLNRSLAQPLVRFGCDGTGTGAYWCYALGRAR